MNPVIPQAGPMHSRPFALPQNVLIHVFVRGMKSRFHIVKNAPGVAIPDLY